MKQILFVKITTRPSPHSFHKTKKGKKILIHKRCVSVRYVKTYVFNLPLKDINI